jgi:enoyl-CoA hydratase/carnithine racemase
MDKLYETIIVKKEGRRAELILNRPEKLNAINLKMLIEFKEALDWLEQDDEVAVVTIKGAGRAFSAGGDLEEVRKMMEAGPNEVRELFNRIERAMEALYFMPKPTIACINGPAMGGGLAIALACDFRLAIEGAKLGMPNVNLGLVTDMGESYLLSRIVGPAKARRLCMLGEILDVRQALELGLVDAVASSDKELAEMASRLVDKLLAKPPKALGLLKSSINNALDRSLHESLKGEAFAQLLCLKSEDAREGVAAFLERRRPSFKGK